MKLNSQYKTKERLLAILLLITFIYLALFAKLFYIQIIDGINLQSKALDQWTRDIPYVATRGKILDANGVILADTSTQYTLYIRPNALKDTENVCTILSNVLKLKYDELYKKISKKGTSEITVAKKVTKEQMSQIAYQGLEGVYFSQDIKRYYPYGDFMTQIIGFTNIDTLGQSGLELFYNEYLQGVNGYQLTETDLIGREIDGNDIKYIPSIDGLNLNLTIDYYIQALAEKSVKSAYSTYNCKSATCIIMDPNSGQIKAIAQSPSFDLNNVPRDNVAELFSSMKSIAISNVYEPGSTFKVVTAAVGLETGLFSDNYTFYCPGYRIIDGQRIKCWKSIGHNSMTFSSGISNSCNCLFMDIATKVGVDSMYEYYYKLGLNKKTGIDISGEASGLLIEQSKVKTVDIARMGFGQAIAITPIEMLAAVSCVINGGYIVTPYILESVTDKDNNIIYRRNTIKGERIFSQKTSDSMRLYLEKVVTEGSGKKAAVSGYQIGGKTGTAQKYENGKIAQGKYISSFMGFTSVNNPEYVCLMIIDEPQGYLYYGSIVAAPYVGDIFANIFQYKGTEPYINITPEITFIMPDLIGLSTTEAAALLKNNKITYEIEGTGTVVYQFPAPNSECNTKTVAFIKLE